MIEEIIQPKSKSKSEDIIDINLEEPKEETIIIEKT